MPDIRVLDITKIDRYDHALQEKGISEMKHLKARVDWVVGWALVALMGVSVVNVLWQVFTRFVLGAPSSFTEELARFLLIWIGVLGAAYCVGQQAHLALELLPEKLEGRRRDVLEVFIQGVVLLFALGVMVIGGGRLVWVQLQLGQTSPALGWPLGLVYLVLPLSGLLIAFYSGVLTVAAARRSEDVAAVADVEVLESTGEKRPEA